MSTNHCVTNIATKHVVLDAGITKTNPRQRHDLAGPVLHRRLHLATHALISGARLPSGPQRTERYRASSARPSTRRALLTRRNSTKKRRDQLPRVAG
ncbi:hypothetical protein ABZ027_20035 [Streptomyces sp. NPDC006332]|uniref:hypothetical protein n=1 Tax=Streptomyces sp. NPDC006332 TaxID=3155456 RepID=UPI0033A898EF